MTGWIGKKAKAKKAAQQAAAGERRKDRLS
jgi:hypothetical protein